MAETSSFLNGSQHVWGPGAVGWKTEQQCQVQAKPCLEVRNIIKSGFVLVEEAMLPPGAPQFPKLSPAVPTASGGCQLSARASSMGR